MTRSLTVLLAATLLAGCGNDTSPDDPVSTAPTTDTGGSASARSPAENGGLAASGAIPKACPLLTDGEVKSLIGMTVGSKSGNTLTESDKQTSCLWSLTPGGSLYLILNRTTAKNFNTMMGENQPVSGVGDAAYTINGHLMVLVETVKLDIIVITDESDARQLERAAQVAHTVIKKL
ncbi:MAG: DUF3558 domain-containing protein [Dactylosporangium sp.]|nr:DUF3558 domain-containing protein [Dactylosporangium sp.]